MASTILRFRHLIDLRKKAKTAPAWPTLLVTVVNETSIADKQNKSRVIFGGRLFERLLPKRVSA
jgi:hypothetical protein